MTVDNEETRTAWVRRVKELMPKKGFNTYQSLAYEAGISAGSLNQAMRGLHLPRQTTIEKIASALGTTPQFLLYGDVMIQSRGVPLLSSNTEIYNWLFNDIPVQDTRMIEPSDDLMTSAKSFAWCVNHHDMAPEFNDRDLVIAEPEGKSRYALATQFGTRTDSGGNRFKQPAGELLFGRIDKTSHGYYLANNAGYQPVYLDESEFIFLGFIVQLIRNY